MTLELDGNHLTIGETCSIARARTADVTLAPAAYEQMNASRALVERLAAGDAPIYAVNTGVGLLADVRIPPADLELLQRNVIRSHCAGVGDPLAREVVRAMMLIRANVLAKGFSGIRPVVAERICELINRGVTPVVPSQGSVGASGDLAPLAHMAMVLIGEGEAEFEGAVMPGADALRRAAIEPLTLAAKEGISLINGTQAMLAIGCLELEAAQVLTEVGRRDLRHDARCAARHAARLRRADPRGAPPSPAKWRAPPACAACWKRARSGSRTSPAGACRTRTRCAAPRRCTARCATPWPPPARYSPSS